MTSPSNPKLVTWDATRQQAYRAIHSATTLVYHFLLDESPSMLGDEALALRKAFNMYLAWLQHHGDPMSLAEVRCFSTPLGPSALQPLGSLQPLTPESYDPRRGNGTALYRAIGETCVRQSAAADQPQQHVLVVFTDGDDNASGQFEWTASKVCTLLQTLQQEQQWLCVFLGAFTTALDVGKACGFTPGNCLAFPTDAIPEAFQSLVNATQKYLTAGPAERKLLTTAGVF